MGKTYKDNLMKDAPPVSPQTVVRMGAELAGHVAAEDDLSAVAALLSGLVGEMGSLRAMAVDDTEPASTYDPSPP
jgi:hypothetical protein